MIVRGITVFVKKGSIAPFIDATVENRAGSINEPGILRFDFLQSREDPGEFFLYEVYTDEDATLNHKETAHYKKWKELVGPMMDKDRIGKAYIPIAPDDAW